MAALINIHNKAGQQPQHAGALFLEQPLGARLD
jgi:hypothetical protein